MINGRFSGAISAAILIAVPASIAAQEADASRTEQAEPAASVEAIAQLVRIWGFVKYHHADAREGRMAMDQEFFDLYPRIAAADSADAADAIFAEWLDRLGPGAPCDPCAEAAPPPPEDIAIASATPDWIATLPESLAGKVRAIHENRSAASGNFQITTFRGVGNARFENEPDYKATKRDGPEMRMLALARIWNTLRYWFPYRDIMDEDVESLLAPAIADVLGAKTREDHHRALARLTAESDDGHALILAYRSSVMPKGDCVIPYGWRFAEDRLVIDTEAADGAGGLQTGDVVSALDGQSIAALNARYSPFIGASNVPSLQSKLAYYLKTGECGERTVTVERAGQAMDVSVAWIPEDEAETAPDGPAIEEVDGGVIHARVAQLTRGDVPALIEAANAGSGLVLDMRRYGREFLLYDIAAALTSEPVEFARFTQPSPATPGQFTWTDPHSMKPTPDRGRITVPVVALVDEGTASSTEFQSMGWRALGATIIGSTTAGADGNVSNMPLPQDGAGMRYSGIGVFYPDKSPTQRIGIVPDIVVQPTIKGIAEGRDEVLERAIEELRSLRDEQT